jgi:hypothetical protein
LRQSCQFKFTKFTDGSNSADRSLPMEAKLTSTKTDNEPETSPRSIADRLVAFAREQATFFHTPSRVAYAAVRMPGYKENWAVESADFRNWLSGRNYALSQTGVSKRTMDSVVSNLSAFAIFEGRQHDVHLRTAKHNGKYYIDPCDERHRVIVIDHEGWRILKTSPVKFTRTSSMRPLPTPKRAGKFSSIYKIINVAKPDRPLVLPWLI